MNLHPLKRFLAAAVTAASLVASAHAGVADQAVQTKAGPVQLIVYPMDAPQVVSIEATMPLGDAFLFTKAKGAINPVAADMAVGLLSAGTTKQDKFAIATKLDRVGASISFEADAEALHISARCLKADAPMVIGLIAEQLRSPKFAPQEFARERVQMEAGLREKTTDTAALASEALWSTIFAKDSPNYVLPREEALKHLARLRLEDVKAFHRRYFGPDHMTMVVTGDVEAAAVEREVRAAFGGWRGGVPFHTPTPTRLPQKASVQQIPVADKASVSVVMGQAIPIKFGDPDFEALDLAVAELGSGFTSRLTDAVRVRGGLTYDIRAAQSGSSRAEGAFVVSTSFAPELKAKGIDVARREIASWWQDGITQEQLAARKSAAIGAHQLAMGTSRGMAGTLLMVAARGLPLRWIDDYPALVERVTVAQANAAIRKAIDPDKLMRVEAGTMPKP